MNGFVIFDRQDAVAKFLREPEVVRLQTPGRFTTSNRDPLIVFRELSRRELSTVRAVADRLGGRIKESTRYEPL